MQREIVEKAKANMRAVLDKVAEQAKLETVPTQNEQVQEYLQVRGDPFKVAQLVVGKLKAFEQATGRPLGKDPLTAAREYERDMEILIKEQQ